MASAAAPATPQRPLPGGYVQTPAPQAPTIFAPQAATLRQHPQAPPASAPDAAHPPATPTVSPVQRAAATINHTLDAEARFPDLESYVAQGMSGEYELPQSANAAWLPFQKLKLHDLPPAIIAQANHTSTGLTMGVFPELKHCYALMDNCLYLWDYTIPSPELIGFEESTAPILTVKLVVPKPGVFVKDITRCIVVATSDTMMLLGVAMQTTATGAQTIALYNTKMHILTRGLNVREIEASTKTGRIFFLASEGEDIYEFQYQQEEGWFRGKCARICHTRSSYDFVPAPVKAVGQWMGPQQKHKKLITLTVDDSRDLMYTLSDTSEIKVWTINDQVKQALSRPMSSLLQNTGHFTGRTDLLYAQDVRLVSLSVIPAAEALKLSLMATTNTGCRLYLSATRGYGIQADAQNAPTSMQILHIRFPPKDPSAPTPQAPPGQSQQTYNTPQTGTVTTTSQLLKPTDSAYRFPPGYFLALQPDPRSTTTRRDRIFCAAPDFARLKNPQDTSSLSSRFAEHGQWIDLPSYNAGAALATAPHPATATPVGFGNELAVQFCARSAEIAIMTAVGVQIIRRRRLVDVFATVMRQASSSPSSAAAAAADDDGDDLKRFVLRYGRGETAATALAVACGQGLDIPQDSERMTTVTDPDVLERARRAFIEHGGKPDFNANAVRTADPLDSVRPSPRHEGLALYISRLVRGVWGCKVVREEVGVGEGVRLVSAVEVGVLRGVQRDLGALGEFLARNRSFIEGLAGPVGVGRVGNSNEEMALHGENRAMGSLVELIGGIVEGIAFALVLFEEDVGAIFAVLAEESRARVRALSYETLFAAPEGRELAKILVKAIVNRNIAAGSNVDSVAEALRRRCGSFCSAEDVVIFKAQEQILRAQQVGGQTEQGRALLNESQRLLRKVAGGLGDEHLGWAVERYEACRFWAGSVMLCLVVARERDAGRRALGWVQEGMVAGGAGEAEFNKRKACYDLVFQTLERLDRETGGGAAADADGQQGGVLLAAKRKAEAYDVIDSHDDAVFQTCLYDWYVATGRPERLLELRSQHVVAYLQRRGARERAHADLLWRYYAHQGEFLLAAATQLEIARGGFPELALGERIAYLSRARANASTRQSALTESRQGRQQLLREIGDLIEVAGIQADVLQRMRGDGRLTGVRREEVCRLLEFSGGVMGVGELFNGFTDQAGYYDLNLLIYQVAEHRNAADVRASWEQLVQGEHDRAVAGGGFPWERVGEKVREMGLRLGLAEATFPIAVLLPLLERYALGPMEYLPESGTWAVEVFLGLGVGGEVLLPVLEGLFYGNEVPWTGGKRRVLAAHMVHVCAQWVGGSERAGERVLCGGEEGAGLVVGGG
ncbi:hypothetical protein LTR08_007254 [Meristemomyces frigidus]|nr:hypothetical protein LTR08_007254 [Meristemomyces frigidus]